MQDAAANADAVLDLLQLRLRKLRASAGEDVLMADCMFELARRLDGRARYDSKEKRKSCTESACESAWISASRSYSATVIVLVLRLVFFRFLMKVTGAVLLLGCFCMFLP